MDIKDVKDKDFAKSVAVKFNADKTKAKLLFKGEVVESFGTLDIGFDDSSRIGFLFNEEETDEEVTVDFIIYHMEEDKGTDSWLVCWCLPEGEGLEEFRVTEI